MKLQKRVWEWCKEYLNEVARMIKDLVYEKEYFVGWGEFKEWTTEQGANK